MKRSTPLRNTGFKRKPREAALGCPELRAALTSLLGPTPHTPKPRAVAAGSGLVGLALSLPALAPEDRTTTKTASEAAYLGRVAALGCIVCRLMGYGHVAGHVHHIRTGQGMAQRAGHHLTLCLCEPHHTGPTGVHGDKSALRMLKLTELDLLDMTIGQLFAQTPTERQALTT